MQFARERASEDLFSELVPLLTLHYREIAHYQDIPLKPDFARYQKLDEMGMLRIFTARDNAVEESEAVYSMHEPTLFGYAVFLVAKNLHYSDSIQAVQDVLFIHPGRRGTGMRFIRWCDEQLREEGVQLVMHHLKVKHDFGRALERQGYELVDKIYCKRLDLTVPSPMPSDNDKIVWETV